MGVDPGKSGAIAVVCCSMDHADFVKTKGTDHDVDAFVRRWSSRVKLAVVEKVSSSPQMGVVSAFTFGRSAGFLEGLLTAHRIPIQKVSPASWQRTMDCRSKGDKNITKAAAQRLFPKEKITHANADALLLAEYAKRAWARQGSS